MKRGVVESWAAAMAVNASIARMIFIFIVEVLAAAPAFPLIFGLGRGRGLPLHIAGSVAAATGNRLDMIDDLARARP